MKCPYCKKIINIMSGKWQAQVKGAKTSESPKFCPHCGGAVSISFHSIRAVCLVLLSFIAFVLLSHHISPSVIAALSGVLVFIGAIEFKRCDPKQEKF
jgi:ribosomal protein S27AE